MTSFGGAQPFLMKLLVHFYPFDKQSVQRTFEMHHLPLYAQQLK